jgi:D-serine dehydratase
MLVGQTLNKSDEPIYGCYIVGRLWYFMILRNNEYIVSKSFTADDEDIYDIVKILKKLKNILFERLEIEIENY